MSRDPVYQHITVDISDQDSGLYGFCPPLIPPQAWGNKNLPDKKGFGFITPSPLAGRVGVGALILLLTIILTTTPSWASDIEPEKIGEITVTADPIEPDTIIDKPTSFSRVINLQKYKKQFIELKDLLSIEAGIHTRDFSGTGQFSTANIRGVSAKGVLVMIDGVPLNGLWSTGVNLSSLPLNGFEKVEIYRGGGGAFYGDIALGGAINLVTGKTDTPGNISLTLGSFNLFEKNTLINFHDPKGDLLVATQTQSSRGDFPFTNNRGTVFDDSDDFTDRRYNNEVDSLGLLFKYSSNGNDGYNHSVVGEFFSSRRGIPGLITFPTPNARQIDQRVFFQTEMNRQNMLPNTDGTIRFHIRSETLDYEDKLGEGTGIPVDTNRRDDLIGFDSRLTRYDPDGMGLTNCSFQLSHEMFNQKNSIRRGRSKSSITLDREMNFQNGDITLHGVSRLDIIDGFKPQLTFRLGSSFDISSDTQLKANIGNSFRVPAFDELYENRGFAVGNADLNPERGFDFDLGIIRSTDDSRLGITLFHNRLRDQIVYELIGGFRYKPFNVGRSDLTGLELTGYKKLGDYNLTLNYTWLDARNRSDSPATNNKRLPSRPEHELFTRIASDFEPLNFEIDYAYASGNFITFANTSRLKDRSRLDLRLKWNHDNAWSLTGEIRNVLNSDLLDIRGFPLPRRAFYLTISHDL